jgi:hypothetical protein
VCFVGELSRLYRVVNTVSKCSWKISYHVLGHFEFHGATVCVCTTLGDSVRTLIE